MRGTCGKCGGDNCGGTCQGYSMPVRTVLLIIATSVIIIGFGAALTGGGTGF